jgi:hypothetical protein
VQKQRRVHHQQEESDVVQGVSAEEVPDGWDVEEWFPVRAAVQLVQDTLPSARTAATAANWQQPGASGASEQQE